MRRLPYPIAILRHALRQPVFLTGVVIAVGLWGFQELAEAVNEGATARFDEAVLLALRDPADPDRLIGPAGLHNVLRDLTALGSEVVLALISVVVCVFLVEAGRKDLGLFAGVAAAGGGIMNYALKNVFDRPRPSLVPHVLADPASYSFPSGHAMASAAIYLTLGAIVAEFAKTWKLKAYVMTVAVVLTLVIGATRVFLGVHYPTDVLAGWALGFLWAYGCRSAVRIWKHYRPLWDARRAAARRAARPHEAATWETAPPARRDPAPPATP